MRVGCHIGIAGGLDKVVSRARDRDCQTMQVFLSAPVAWKGSCAVRDGLPEFGAGCRQAGIHPVFVHTVYLINLAAGNPGIRRRSLAALKAGMLSVGAIGGQASLVTHLGSHLGEGEKAGLRRIVNELGKLLYESPPGVSLLLETSAGAGDSMGSDFAQMGAIVRALGSDPRIRICMDTCHVFAAGYDLSRRDGIEKTLAGFDRDVGLSRLKMIHANDSRGARGSGLDRHEYLGKGRIGLEAFRYMVNHEALRDLPWILETPKMIPQKDREQMRLLASLQKNRRVRG